MTSTTRPSECTTDRPMLYVAIDSSKRSWKLALSQGLGSKVRHASVPAWDVAALQEAWHRAIRAFRLPTDVSVVVGQEAGRDGFAIHRLLITLGVTSVVMDASSIEVPRRQRRAKTDRLDAAGLLRVLLLYAVGAGSRVRVLRVPSVEDEDARQLHRELSAAQTDVHRVQNRIESLLATQGTQLPRRGDRVGALATLSLPDGRTLPPQLRARLERDLAVLDVLEARVRTLEQERHQQVLDAEPHDPRIAKIRQLMELKAIGETGAWLLVMEYLGWRTFRNRREVAGGVGITGTPFDSGETTREQGISKAGNDRVRRLMVELAWAWRRFQPHSELARWYERRWGGGTRRMRRVGIVALARKLLIALWRYLETGELPAGAALKHAA